MTTEVRGSKEGDIDDDHDVDRASQRVTGDHLGRSSHVPKIETKVDNTFDEEFSDRGGIGNGSTKSKRNDANSRFRCTVGISIETSGVEEFDSTDLHEFALRHLPTSLRSGGGLVLTRLAIISVPDENKNNVPHEISEKLSRLNSRTKNPIRIHLSPTSDRCALLLKKGRR
jgi:hypothetical protein